MSNQPATQRVFVNQTPIIPEIVIPTRKEYKRRTRKPTVKALVYTQLNKPMIHAALLEASGSSMKEICDRVGISKYQLNRMRRMDFYKDEVAKQINIVTAKMSAGILSDQKRRLVIRDELYESMEVIRDRRKELSAKDPLLKEHGGETGLVLKHIMFDRQGNKIEQFEVDHGTVDQIKSLMNETAKDLGQMGGDKGSGVSITINLTHEDQALL